MDIDNGYDNEYDYKYIENVCLYMKIYGLSSVLESGIGYNCGFRHQFQETETVNSGQTVFMNKSGYT